MPGPVPHSESWKKMVLRSMPSPAWLSPDAPEGEIVVSTRVRFARNLIGHPFPHHADVENLRAIQAKVVEGTKKLKLEVLSRVSEAERDFLLGSRLVSPEFLHREPGRCVLLDKDRSVSLMVNEEDHVRLQGMTAGWSLKSAELAAQLVLETLGAKCAFMRTDTHGYLTASPYNCGLAQRRSVLFHLIGLAQSRRLPEVLRALSAGSLYARGLFGESSRAVGAFFQVSSIDGNHPEFVGACEYLVREERQARREITRDKLHDKTKSAIEFAVASAGISLADALRVLAWVRWASTAGLDICPFSYRDVDLWVSTMEVHGTQDPQTADRHRAVFLRERIET